MTEVTNLAWAPSAGQTREDVGRAIQKDLQVNPPTNCQSCHR